MKPEEAAAESGSETLLYVFSTNPKQEPAKQNVVVPYANDVSDPVVFKAMRLNLVMQGIEPRYVKMDVSSDYAYDTLIRELWEKGEPFVIVEHDILPWPGAVQQLWECDQPWCGYPYFVQGGLSSYLGCVKFDPLLLGTCPLPPEKLHWAAIDISVIEALAGRGFDGHLHGPPVSHLHFGHQIITSASGQMNPDLPSTSEGRP